jgi:D-lactate dehydrogenase
MPTAARMPKPRPPADTGKPRVVYFPSCASRTMGPARGDPERDSLPVKLDALLRKAGYEVVYPENLKPLCCGMAFDSKGMFGPADAKLREVEQALFKASRNGKDPVVMDTSPCAFRMIQHLQADFKLWDITAFLHDQVMERLTLQKSPETVALHYTCSTRKLGLEDKLRRIAEACVEKVIIPEDVPCCGWAGDKGFTVPELNASAVRNLRSSLPEECRTGYSTSRTCEIGLSFHSGRHFRSIAYLVDRCSTPG